ncbi:hypothetical protein BDA96_07G097100 [Sorghum bicolor]|uniref:Uncharacterized protein n=1 Tax=Sorghum bicolor TaxID=4558 RepID=A0A921QK03_SORBI|nr:hypothetical protein BDA96_07G097100 [Sorghum bicolor]
METEIRHPFPSLCFFSGYHPFCLLSALRDHPPPLPPPLLPSSAVAIATALLLLLPPAISLPLTWISAHVYHSSLPNPTSLLVADLAARAAGGVDCVPIVGAMARMGSLHGFERHQGVPRSLPHLLRSASCIGGEVEHGVKRLW